MIVPAISAQTDIVEIKNAGGPYSMLNRQIMATNTSATATQLNAAAKDLSHFMQLQPLRQMLRADTA
jgi:hypothetical protein